MKELGDFGEVVTAMVTPLTSTGEIDYGKTADLIAHLLKTGSDALVVTGTTGEGATLSTEEKIGFWEAVVRMVDQRVPVLAGVGTNCTQTTIEFGRRSQEVGCDGCMVVVPYYNKPDQGGIYAHFARVAAAVDLPIMLYNVPSRTVSGLQLETIVQLSQLPNIVAIKDASGDLNGMSDMIGATDLAVYCGDDSLTLPAVAIGAKGVVSVVSHLCGLEMKQMLAYFRKGEQNLALSRHQQIARLAKAVFATPNPVGIKTALNTSGIDVGGVRLPLVEMSAHEAAQLRATLETWRRGDA